MRSNYHCALSVTREQAMGGAVAIVAGAFVYNSMSYSYVTYPTSVGSTYLQDCRVAVTGSSFTDCKAGSFTGGPAVGTASVYGGALSLLHSPQVSTFINNFWPPSQAPKLAGFNATFSISSCSFTACSAVTNSTSVVPGAASSGGGAVYFSVAFANVSLQSSSFSSCSVVVAIGAIGFPASNSSGGGISVEIPSGSIVTNASVLLSSNTFWNCSANGAGQYSPFTVVRGGGVAVSRAAAIKISNTSFSACSVAGASSISVVSGGAGLSAVLVPSVSLTGCWFDGAASQDSSGTSAGLLVLPSGAAPARIAIGSCSFSSVGNVSLKVACVDAATGLNSAACVQPGPAVSALNSNISQLAPGIDGSDFSSIGSAMVSLQQNVSVASSNSLLVCNSTQFAVFRKQLFQNVLYSCSPCPNLQVALTSNAALLETVSAISAAPLIAQCMPLPSATSCPFGIAACTTSVNVTSGFWAAFSNYSVTNRTLTLASRCPPGYCSCGSTSCPLQPPLAYNENPNSLCAGNRTGVLCGGCPPSFTQSIDGKTCISNDDCAQNLGWVWTLSVLGYSAFSLYVVVNCGKHSSGLFSCVLFYFQMSSFASSLDESNASNAILHYSQFQSIVSLHSKACYALNMSAYSATLAGLIGPLFVLVFAVAWTWIILVLQPRLQQRSIDMSVSYSGTLAVSILFVFSSVASVVFTLVQCTRDGVVFIDGTVACYDNNWKVLIAVVVLLCLVPVAFAAALRLNKLPEDARAAVCQAYTAPMFYWGAVTLGFRLLISVTLFLQAELPNVLAFVRLFLSTCMLLLLVHLRPYVYPRTFWVDVVCYLCLIAQFGLQTMVADRDFLGVAAAQTDSFATFFQHVSTMSTVFRCGSKANANLTVIQSPAIANEHNCRYLPVAVFAVVWLRTKIFFGNLFKALGRRAAALARSVMQRFSTGSNATNSKEMNNRLL
jgi:hypothetical protein